jgi:signal peptidase II
MMSKEYNKKHIQILYIYLTVISIVILDQISKYIIKHTMHLYDSIPVFGNFFKITYIENPGMAFGIQMENKLLFTFFSIVAAVIILIYLIRLPNERFVFRFSLALIMGGAIGNLIDRLFAGRVVDFLDVEFFDITIPAFEFIFINFPGYALTRWPVFNIADSAVTCGMILIAWLILFQKSSLKEQTSALE